MKLISTITNQELKSPITDEDFLTTNLVLDSSDMAKLKWINDVYKIINRCPFNNENNEDINELLNTLMKNLSVRKIFIELSDWYTDNSNIFSIFDLTAFGVFENAEDINNFISEQNQSEDLN